MRFTRCFVLVAVLVIAGWSCGPGRTTFARYPGAATTFDRAGSDPKALEIADRVIAAAGGVEAWNRAKQVRWAQSITQDGKEVIGGEQVWDRWNGRHRAQLRREGGDLVVMRPVFESGGQAFIDNGQRLRKIQDGTEDALARARERWDFDTAILFMPFLLQEPGVKLSYVGETLGEDEKPHDDIKVTFDPKDRTRTTSYRVIVDRDTHLIHRIEIQKPGQAETNRLGYLITERIEAGGMKLPATIENLGMRTEVVKYADVKVSEPDDDLFIPPPLL
jgi:hypothetical protein